MTPIERLEEDLDIARRGKLPLARSYPNDLAALIECVKAQNEALRLIAAGEATGGQTVGPMQTYQMRAVAKAAVEEVEKKVGLKK